MSQLAVPLLAVRAAQPAADRSATRFAIAALAVVVVSAVLAGFVPLQFSIVTVFLFAGPHNWVEFRYFLSRMPAKWGPLRAFFLTAIGGVLTLTASFIAMPILSRQFDWSGATLTYAAATWDSALVLWVAALVALRNHHRVHRRSPEAGSLSPNAPSPPNSWHLPMAVAFLVISGIWIYPAAWDVALVYLHPLIALWFLDREITRHRPQWQRTYRRCLLAVPVALALLWWQLIHAPPLAGNDMLTMRITRHAGADVLTGISSHALVATHTFLEMLHYGVWLVAIPLVAMRAKPWDLADAPICRSSKRWQWAVAAAGVAGLLVVLGLWGAFLVNYPLTRDIYFMVAIGHVLAEVSFLLRLL
jgi:hypothetical protein